jgi:hypothetical protein
MLNFSESLGPPSSRIIGPYGYALFSFMRKVTRHASMQLFPAKQGNGAFCAFKSVSPFRTFVDNFCVWGHSILAVCRAEVWDNGLGVLLYDAKRQV